MTDRGRADGDDTLDEEAHSTTGAREKDLSPPAGTGVDRRGEGAVPPYMVAGGVPGTGPGAGRIDAATLPDQRQTEGSCRQGDGQRKGGWKQETGMQEEKMRTATEREGEERPPLRGQSGRDRWLVSPLQARGALRRELRSTKGASCESPSHRVHGKRTARPRHDHAPAVRPHAR